MYLNDFTWSQKGIHLAEKFLLFCDHQSIFAVNMESQSDLMLTGKLENGLLILGGGYLRDTCD
jgi:hypothetical protein